MIRLIWPDIKAARAVGHTLQVIHERIVEIGIPISYRLFTCYVSRLRREESAAQAGKGQIAIQKLGPRVEIVKQKAPSPPPPGNFQNRRIENPQPGFNLDGGHPDEDKLI